MSASNEPHTILEMVDDENVRVYPATAFQVEIVKAMNALPRDRQQSVCRMMGAMTMNILATYTVTAWTKSGDPYGAFDVWWTALPEVDRIRIDAACSAAGMPVAA